MDFEDGLLIGICVLVLLSIAGYLYYNSKDSIAIRAIEKAQKNCILAIQNKSDDAITAASKDILAANELAQVAMTANGGMPSDRLLQSLMILRTLKCNSLYTEEQRAITAVNVASASVAAANKSMTQTDHDMAVNALGAANTALTDVTTMYSDAGLDIPKLVADAKALYGSLKLAELVSPPALELDTSKFQLTGVDTSTNALYNQPAPLASNYVGPAEIHLFFMGNLELSIEPPGSTPIIFSNSAFNADVPASDVYSNPRISKYVPLQIKNVKSGSKLNFKITTVTGWSALMFIIMYNGRLYISNSTVGMSAMSTSVGVPRDGISNGTSVSIVGIPVTKIGFEIDTSRTLESLAGKMPILMKMFSSGDLMAINTVDNGISACDVITRSCTNNTRRSPNTSRMYSMLLL